MEIFLVGVPFFLSLTNCGIRVKKRTGVLVGRSYQGLMGGLSLNIEMHEG